MGGRYHELELQMHAEDKIDVQVDQPLWEIRISVELSVSASKKGLGIGEVNRNGPAWALAAVEHPSMNTIGEYVTYMVQRGRVNQ